MCLSFRHARVVFIVGKIVIGETNSDKCIFTTFHEFPGLGALSHSFAKKLRGRGYLLPRPDQDETVFLQQYAERDPGMYFVYSDNRVHIRVNWVYLIDGDEDTCYFPDCESRADHTHHVYYEGPRHPYGLQVRLCFKHHEDITIINGIQARKKKPYRKLSQERRWEIWKAWLAGDLKPRRTKKAMAWVGKWQQPVAERVTTI